MAEKETKDNLRERAPVVAVLGHVDHGKSSLLEAIREDFVITEKEAGGITQHIGAYEVEVKDKKLTFIDTPGHEAFSAMRQRGANVADIAVLVIDVGEGVKAQTKEAIKFIKKAEVPMVAAFNKIDKPGADPEKVKGQLSKEEVLVESYGGKVPSVNVSAKEKKGIDELLETLLLLAEMEELRADFEGPAWGVVIESSLDDKKGPLATLLVKDGALKEGDIIATHEALGRVKGLADFQGNMIKQALPSQPVSVLGFEKPPVVGTKFKVYQTKEQAQENLKDEEKKYLAPQVVDTENSKKVLNIVLKVDVLGSAEAIEGILDTIPQEKVMLRVLRIEAGEITTVDIKLAESGKAHIFSFRVKISEATKFFASQKRVKVFQFDVIYELVQSVREQMLKVLEPETRRVDVGKFKISHLFKQNKKEQIVGGRVIEGELTQNSLAEVIREEEIAGRGRIKRIEQEKKEIGKAVKGKEAGILFQGDVKIEEGDVLNVYREEREKTGL